MRLLPMIPPASAPVVTWLMPARLPNPPRALLLVPVSASARRRVSNDGNDGNGSNDSNDSNDGRVA